MARSRKLFSVGSTFFPLASTRATALIAGASVSKSAIRSRTTRARVPLPKATSIAEPSAFAVISAGAVAKASASAGCFSIENTSFGIDAVNGASGASMSTSNLNGSC